MRVMLYGFAAVILIAVASDQILNHIGVSSQERMSGASTRLGN